MDASVSEEDGIPDLWFSTVADQYSQLSGKGKTKLLKCLLEKSTASEISFLEGHFKALQHRDFICLLPSYIVEILLTYLDVKMLCRCRQVSRQWKSVIDSCERTWKVKCQHLRLKLDSPKVKQALETKSENYRSLCIRMKKFYNEMDNGQGFQIKSYGSDCDYVRAVALWKNNLVSCFEDGIVAVWDTRTGDQLCKAQIGCSHIMCAQLDDTTLLVCTSDGYLIALEPATLSIKQWYRRHSGCVYCIAFNSVADVAISGSSDQTVKVWSLSQGTLKSTFTGHEQWVRSVCLSPIPETSNSSQLKSANVASLDAKNIIVWRLTTHEILIKISSSEVFALGVYLDEQFVWYIRHPDFRSKLCRYDISGHAEYVYPNFFERVKRLLAATKTFALVIDNEAKSMGMTIYDLRNMKRLVTPTVDKFDQCYLLSVDVAIGHKEWMHGFDGFNHYGVIAAWGYGAGNLMTFKW